MNYLQRLNCGEATTVNFSRVSLRGASLHATNLMNADLRCADLTGANLAEADLIAADVPWRSSSRTSTTCGSAGSKCARGISGWDKRRSTRSVTSVEHSFEPGSRSPRTVSHRCSNARSTPAAR
ncbi:MAG: pentapeptide repeat-containing protein [Acidobacteria bacterium]|nr:pentapeptide repeat-containing protein [Acidobacteriota bacterium]